MAGKPLGSVYVTEMLPAVAPVVVNVSVGLFRSTEKISGVDMVIGVPAVAPEAISGIQYLYETVES